MKKNLKNSILIIGMSLSMINPFYSQPTKLIYGSDHTTLGNADINISNRHATISNLTNSGSDGVKINFLDGEYHTDLAQQEYPEGSKVKFELFGTLNGVSEKISEASIISTATSKKILPDFNAVGSEFYTIEIFDGSSNLVARRTGLKDPTVILNSDPRSKTKTKNMLA